MSFLSKALRRAEVFLEQVDESVAQANRRLVVEGATGGVDDEDGWVPSADDPLAAGVLSGNKDAERSDDDALMADEVPFQRRSGAAKFSRAGRDAHQPKAAPSGLPGFVPGNAVRELKESLFRGAQFADERDTSVAAKPATKGSGGPSRPAKDVSEAEEEDGWGELDIPDPDAPSGRLLEDDDKTDENRRGSRVLANAPAAERAGATFEKPMPSAAENASPALKGSENAAGVGAEGSRGREASGTPGVVTGGHGAISDDPPQRGDNADAAVSEPRMQVLSRVKELPQAESAEVDRDVADEGEDSEDSDVRTLAQPKSNPSLRLSPKLGNASPPVDSSVELLKENGELRKELELAEDDIENLVKERGKLVNNIRRLKDVVSEMDESLDEKSAEVRRLGNELGELKDDKNKLQKQLRETLAKSKDSLDVLRKELAGENRKLEQDLNASRVELERLRSESASLREALTQGREVDRATADDARMQASKAQKLYEEEVAAHRETREALKAKQEAIDGESAATATAIAAAQRKADEASTAAAAARSAQRDAESRLSRLTSARDAALARVADLTKELAFFKEAEDGSAPGAEELASLRQTVTEMGTALAAKNVELTRLEGEVENMRNVVRTHSEFPNSPGRPGGVGSDTSNSHEVEQKLRHMADAALRKQAQLEVLRSENKALQHQVDTERKRTREAQAMAAVATSSRHNLRGGIRGILDVSDEERGSRSYVPREGPMARLRTPRSWPVAVTRFLGSLDKLSAEALTFLRREPLLRIVLLIYVCAMHLLVYGLLHFHVEATMGGDQLGGIHAHPHAPLMQHK